MLFLHWVGNRFLSLVTNVLYNTTLSDMETCYKLFDRDAARRHHAARRPLRHRARDHRQDPARKDPHLRGADLVHRPRVRRRQEDHLARRLRRAVDARQVPLRRLDRDRRAGPRRAGPRWSSTTKPGPLLHDVRRARCSPTRAPGRPSSSWSTTARATARSPRCARAFPDVAVVDARREPRVRARREPRDRGDDRAASSRCCNADLDGRAGHRGGAARRASTPSPTSRAVGPAAAQPRRLATTRRPGRCRRRRDAVGHALLGRSVPDEPLHPPLPPARRRPGPAPATSTGCRARRSGCGATRSTRSAAGTSGTSCTWRTSTCAGGCGASGGGSRYEPARRRRARAGREHRPAPVPDARRAPPVGVPLRAPAGGTGRGACCSSRRPRVPGRACAPSAWPRGRCGRVPRRRGSAGNLRPPWPSQSRTKPRAAMRSEYRKPEAARAADRSAGTSPSRSSSSSASSPSSCVAVAATAPGAARRAADAAANEAGDHWHAALGVNICGEWLDRRAGVREAGRQPETRRPTRASTPTATA